MKKAMLTLAMVAMVGCDAGTVWQSIGFGAGNTTGAAVADFVLGLLGL